MHTLLTNLVRLATEIQPHISQRQVSGASPSNTTCKGRGCPAACMARAASACSARRCATTAGSLQNRLACPSAGAPAAAAARACVRLCLSSSTVGPGIRTPRCSKRSLVAPCRQAKSTWRSKTAPLPDAFWRALSSMDRKRRQTKSGHCKRGLHAKPGSGGIEGIAVIDPDASGQSQNLTPIKSASIREPSEKTRIWSRSDGGSKCPCASSSTQRISARRTLATLA